MKNPLNFDKKTCWNSDWNLEGKNMPKTEGSEATTPFGPTQRPNSGTQILAKGLTSGRLGGLSGVFVYRKEGFSQSFPKAFQSFLEISWNFFKFLKISLNFFKFLKQIFNIF